MELNFADWIKMQESATTSGDVAGFSRISIPLIRRISLGHWGEEDPFFKKKKKKKKIDEGPIKMFSPDTPHYKLDKAQHGTLYCQTCGRSTRVKHMYRPRFNDLGEIVDGLCPKCALTLAMV